MRVGDQLLRDELRSVARADNQGRATWIVSPPPAILDSHRPDEQPWQGDRCGRKECVDEHDGEGNTARRDLRGRQKPETNRGGNNGCGAAGEQNLPELPNARLAPEAPVHPEIVKHSETEGTGEEDVR